MEERVKNKGETTKWVKSWIAQGTLCFRRFSRCNFLIPVQDSTCWIMRNEERQCQQCGATDTQRYSWQLIDAFFSLAIALYYTICFLHNDTIRENIINYIWNDVKQKGSTQPAPILSSLKFCSVWHWPSLRITSLTGLPIHMQPHQIEVISRALYSLSRTQRVSLIVNVWRLGVLAPNRNQSKHVWVLAWRSQYRQSTQSHISHNQSWKINLSSLWSAFFPASTHC